MLLNRYAIASVQEILHQKKHIRLQSYRFSQDIKLVDTELPSASSSLAARAFYAPHLRDVPVSNLITRAMQVDRANFFAFRRSEAHASRPASGPHRRICHPEEVLAVVSAATLH